MLCSQDKIRHPAMFVSVVLKQRKYTCNSIYPAMSALKYTSAHSVGAEFIEPYIIQASTMGPFISFTEEAISPTLDTVMVLLRRAFILNKYKSRCHLRIIPCLQPSDSHGIWVSEPSPNMK